MNMPERRAAEWLADVLLTSPVALVTGVRVGPTVLPVLDEGPLLAASPAAAKLRVEILDQAGSGLREPSQLHAAQRRIMNDSARKR